VYLGPRYCTRWKLPFLNVVCVEFDVVRKDARVSFLALASKDLLHSTLIVLLTRLHESLTQLLKCIIRLVVGTLYLYPLGNALLTVTAHRGSVLTITLLLF
jgi:hypothetical protein